MSATRAIELRIWRLLITVTVVAALYFLRDLILPVAVAALLAFVLSPVVIRLERLTGRIPAVLLTSAVALVLIGAFAWAASVEVGRLAQDLPTYKANLSHKLQALNTSGSERFGRVTSMLEELQRENAQPASQPGTSTPTGQVRQPVPVQVQETPAQGSSRLLDTAGRLLEPLGFIGAVLILAIFMLLKHDDLRDRIIGLLGRGQLVATTAAMRDAASRVYRYLLMSLVVNTSYGIAVGIGLYFIGVPSALLWAVLAIVLRFIPYLGPLIAMAFPILLSLAVFDGWNGLLLTVGLFLVLEVISNNVVEPWLYGASTGVSSFALILAALAWTWLWGPVGLLLSTPLTVCLLVMGKHVPQLAFLRTVLSDERALALHEVFYQRLLAGDPGAASKAIAIGTEQRSTEDLFAGILLPALAMAQDDLRRGVLDRAQHRTLTGLMRDIIDHMEDMRQVEQAPAPGVANVSASAAPPLRLKLACLGVDGDADAVSAEMLAHVARERGFAASVVDATLTTDRILRAIDDLVPDVVWLCVVNPESLSRCRRLCAELRDRNRDLRISVGIWHAGTHQGPSVAGIATHGANVVSTDFGESVMHLEAFRDTFSGGYLPAPIPDDEVDRIAAIVASGLDGDSRDELFDRTTAELTRVFSVPIALVTLVDSSSQHFLSSQGLDSALEQVKRTARDVSVCGHVVAANRPVVIEDLARDPRFAGNPLLREKSLRFYAGVPLRTSGGFAIGSLCILDHVPRQVSEREVRLLQMIAENLMFEVEERVGKRGDGRLNQ